MMIGIAVILMAVVAGVSAEDYCNVTCGIEVHTMCKHKTEESVCANTEVFLTQGEKDEILKKHNKLRAEVTAGNPPCQPAALNMELMVWNDELASIARRWGIQCPVMKGHDFCRKKLDGTGVGQNMWGGHIDNYMMGIQGWYDEKDNFPPDLIGSFRMPNNGKAVGHYTQVAWAKSNQLGCELVRDKDVDLGVLFCNYAPAGNVNGEPVYETKAGVDYSACKIAGAPLTRGKGSRFVVLLSVVISAVATVVA